MSRTVLLVGDGVVATGFSKMNHAYINGLKRAGWNVHMLAMNYHGDPHKYDFPIYPCRTIHGGDAFGISRLKSLVEQIRPDVVCVTQDPWNMPLYLQRLKSVPVVASIAVDGKNCRGSLLNGCRSVVFWTAFGEAEAKAGGYSGPSTVIPLGVDLETFYPVSRDDARQFVGLPKHVMNAFIVGVVGRNQPRKRLDITMVYFADWIKRFSHDDAYLFLHVAPTGDEGYDLKQLGEYLGIANRIIISEPPLEYGTSLEGLRNIYSSFDVCFTTTQGEGWGLCQMEAMACGVPCIVPSWSALGEWARNAAIQVLCSSVICTPNMINAVGGLMDPREAMKALEMVYVNEKTRSKYGDAGLLLVADPRFRWENIGDRFAEVVEAALDTRIKTTISDEQEMYTPGVAAI